MRLRYEGSGSRRVGRPLFALGISVATIGVLLIGVGVWAWPDVALADAERAESRDERRVDAKRHRQEMSPHERHQMRDRARQRWRDANPRERRLFQRGMGALELALPDFSPIERRLLLRKFSTLPEPERQALRRRLRGIDELEPKEREKFIHELRDRLSDSPAETDRIDRNLHRWRRMSESERDQYREQLRRFREMSAEERRILLDRWEEADPASGRERD